MKIFKLVKPGVASIPLVLGMLVLTISIGLFISTVSLSDSLSSNNLQVSAQALEYAKTGAQDVLLNIARNPSYGTSNYFQVEMVSGGCAGDYSGCVNSSYQPSVMPTSSTLIINSEGRIGNIKRTVQVNVNLDAYGGISSYTWQ